MYLFLQAIEVLGRMSIMQQIWSNPVGLFLCKVFGFFYFSFLLPHCFLAFVLLKADKFMPAMAASGWFLQVKNQLVCNKIICKNMLKFLQIYMFLGFVAVKILAVLIPKQQKPNEEAKRD